MLKRNYLFTKEKKSFEIPIDMAPLIDCVLLLIIFFMLTSTFIMQPGFKIDMPAAETFTNNKTPLIFCYITKDNKLFLNEKEVLFGDFDEEIKNLLMQSEEKVVSIKADKEVNYGLLINIIDRIHLNGGEAVNLVTVPVDLEQLKIEK